MTETVAAAFASVVAGILVLWAAAAMPGGKWLHGTHGAQAWHNERSGNCHRQITGRYPYHCGNCGRKLGWR